MKPPARGPEGVVAVLKDGSRFECTVKFVRYDSSGLAVWQVVPIVPDGQTFDLGKLRRVKMAYMPGGMRLDFTGIPNVRAFRALPTGDDA